MTSTTRRQKGQRLVSRSGVRLAALLFAIAIVIAACAADDDPGEAIDDPDAPEEPADPDADAVEKPRMVVALSTNVDLIEPHTFRTTGAYAVTEALYDPLLRQVLEEVDGGKILQGVPEVTGAIAEGFTIEDDGTATFTIRQDAAFEDGTPITAGDVAYSFERSILGPGYIGALLPFINISSPDQIEVVDDHTLVLRPDGPSPLFERFMTFQVFGAFDQARVEAAAPADDEWGFGFLGETPTVSGPYQLVEFDRERQIVLEPNPYFYRPDAILNDGVTVQIVPDADQRALLLQAGDLDFVDGLPPRLLEELDGVPDIDVVSVESSRIVYLGMNNQIEPFDNVTLRQAVSYAVPYDVLIEQVQRGFARTAGNLVTSPMDTYAGDEIGTYTEDLERAAELLEESGVGDDVTIELAVRQSRAMEQEAAVFIQDNLRAVGLDVEVNILPDGEFSERLNAKELQMFIHDWFSWGEDPFYQMRFLVHSGAFTNFTQFQSQELDALIEEGTFETDPGRRADLSRQAQQILLDEAPMAYLYAPNTSFAVRQEVCGVAVDFTQVVRFDTLTTCDYYRTVGNPWPRG